MHQLSKQFDPHPSFTEQLFALAARWTTGGVMTCPKKDEGRRLRIGGASGMSRSVNGSTLPKIALPGLFDKTARAACHASAHPALALLALANSREHASCVSAAFTFV